MRVPKIPSFISPNSEVKAWFVWSFSALFYFYQIILRNFPGIMTEDLMRDFCVEACALGVLSASYLLSYSTLQIPVGLAMDRFGPTRLLRGAILLCCLGTTLFALCGSVYLACFGRFLIGMGATCAFLGSVKLGTQWFPPEKLAFVVGVIMVAATVGATSGQAPLALVVEILGWRQTLLYVLVPIGVFLALCIWIFVKDNPQEHVVGESAPRMSLGTLLVHLKEIVLNYRIWAIGLYGGLMYLPILAFVDLWGIPFLVEIYGISRAQAGTMTTMFYIGIGIGSPLIAILSDALQKRKIPMIVGACFAILINGTIIYVPDIPFYGMYVLLLLGGIAFSTQPLIFSTVCQLTPKTSNGTAVSFTNMLVMILGLVAQPLIGRILELSWGGAVINGVPYYEVFHYRLALSSVVISLVLALVMMIFIPETFPRVKKSKNNCRKVLTKSR